MTESLNIVPQAAQYIRYSIEVEFNTARALERWQLLEAHAHSSAFQTHAFISVWIEQYGEAGVNDPFFVFITGKDGDIGAIPLVLVTQKHLRTIRFLGLRESDYSALMVSNESDALPELSSIWPLILENLPACDLLSINKIPQIALFPGLDLASLSGLQPTSSSGHPAMLSTGSGDPAGMQSKVLADLKRRRRRLEEHGELQFVVCKTADEAVSSFEKMAELRIARFDAIGRKDGLKGQKHYSFYRTLCQRFPEFAIVTGLYLDGQPIALQYGLRGKSRYYQLITAFADGPLRVYAPGRLLMLQTLRWCAGQGIGIFDFTIGNEPYKKDFGTRELPLMELVTAFSWKGRAYLAGRHIIQALSKIRFPSLPRRGKQR